MSTLLEAMNSRTIYFDGAMGTELQKMGLSEDPALLNLTHPGEIINIHRQYLDAGADIITANTFGAYSHKYSNASDMIKAAIAHGKKALESNPDKWLALDLGPTGLMLEPYGDITEDECSKIYEEAIQTGAQLGADVILIETMMDLTELKIAVTAAKKANLPVFATMSFEKNGRTMMGVPIEDMVAMLESLGVDALGMNCGFGPDIYADLAAKLYGLTTLPIIIQPNAGLPITDDTLTTVRYNLTVDEFAATMALMNVKIKGGCCGTSPAHIAALVKQ